MVGRWSQVQFQGDEKMGTIIVTCDACGTKNKIEESKADVARCGRCKNPLLDAIQEQLGLFTDQIAPEEPDDEDAETGGTLPHGTKFSGNVPSAADVMKDLFGDFGTEIPCKIRCKSCGKMFVGTADCELCQRCVDARESAFPRMKNESDKAWEARLIRVFNNAKSCRDQVTLSKLANAFGATLPSWMR
jgi:hypothetical protein